MTHCKSGMDRTSVGDARRYALQKLNTTWEKINANRDLEQLFVKEVYNYLLTVCPYFQLGRGIAATKSGVRSGHLFKNIGLFFCCFQAAERCGSPSGKSSSVIFPITSIFFASLIIFNGSSTFLYRIFLLSDLLS